MDIFKEEKAFGYKLFALLLKFKWVIVITCIAAFGLSVLATSLMKPRYLANGIVFPTFSNSIEEIINNPQFGYDIQADRLIQIMESEKIRREIIDSFDLIEYYEIDTTRIDWEFNLDKKYVEDITFFRSKYMSVVISAELKDPHLSASVVNYVIDLTNKQQEEIFKVNFNKELDALDEQYQAQKINAETLKDSIDALITAHPNLQLAYYEIKYGSETLDKKGLDAITLDYEKLFLRYNYELNRTEELYKKYIYTKAKIDRPFPNLYEIDRAAPRFKKSSPSYRTNALIATGAAFVFIVLFLWVRERYRNIKQDIEAAA